jgi:DNA-binding NarL/FixJ family response regulator
MSESRRGSEGHEHHIPPPIRVVMVDDHPVVRAGIRHLLQGAPDITIIGEASDGSEALRIVARAQPDVLLLDVMLPDMSGVVVAQRVKEEGWPVHILALSAYDDERYILGMLAAGAAGYLIKEEASETITEAVRAVARGEIGWLSRRAIAVLLGRVTDEWQKSQVMPPGPMPDLSARERQVLRLLAHGYENAQIAAALCIAEGTVKNHVTSIYGRIGVRTRAEAVAWAWRHGISETLPSSGVPLTHRESQLGPTESDTAPHMTG